MKNILNKNITPINCGPYLLFLLSKNELINNNILLKKLHPKEKSFYNSIKALNRKQEFLRLRWMFHELTESNDPLLPNLNHAPIWPKNYTGSISHKNGNVILLIDYDSNNKSYGIDIELINKVKPILINKICNKNEINLAKTLPENLSIIFSFKESVFKAHYPVINEHFYFKDVDIINIDMNNKKINAKFTNKNLIQKFSLSKTITGNYKIISINNEKYIITVTSIKAS